MEFEVQAALRTLGTGLSVKILYSLGAGKLVESCSHMGGGGISALAWRLWWHLVTLSHVLLPPCFGQDLGDIGHAHAGVCGYFQVSELMLRSPE